MKFNKISVLLCLSVFFSLALSLSTNAQVRPVNDYGALGLARLLKQLQTTGSVMMIGAHPDDEDSALLAYLARGENARTAYLSLTRGDGGQNIIGPELFESLGVIRTEELLQARRLDGAEQYFTRAFDYGFSKTLDEAKSKWPEEVIKCDVVRAIRLFRPLVVISRFSGTPQDGHGQHQYAGYITPIAVKAAGDPQQCKDAGEPWTVQKFYIESGFNDNSEPTLKINTGMYDRILGRTYFEIAMEGRSQHRSQGEGRIEFHGDSFSGLNLVGAAKRVKEKSIFDAVKFGPQVILENLRETPDLSEPQVRLLPALAFHYKELRSKLEPDGQFRYPQYLEKTAAAIRKAAGIQIDALADSETVVPGGTLMVSVKAFQPKDAAANVGEITLSAPKDWIVSKSATPQQNNAAYASREIATAGQVFAVNVPASASVTDPYWLRSERKSDLFPWPGTDSLTLPFDPPQLIAHVKVNVGGTDIVLDQPVQYRFADPARGEIRREVNVVPPVSVEFDKDLLIAPRGAAAINRRVNVSVSNKTSKPVLVKLDVIKPGIGTVTAKLSKPELELGSRASVNVEMDIKIAGETMSPPFRIGISAELEGVKYWQTMYVVSYPHIQTHRFYTRAATKVVLLDLVTEPVNVGYVMGSGDDIPDAIRQMGMNVTLLGEEELSSGDLAKFDTIVVGIRASETRPDLVANNARLLDYARSGGTVIFEYQRGTWTGLAPYKVDIQDKQGTTAGSIARVVDENAPVKVLEPQHPVFNFPNKITDADFAGWVQERNAYNLVTFDPQYTPLLESHDAGEQENKGGLVIAKVGKGNWVYCSYSFFRQLPAGVPGAYRLFANLLSLPKAR